MHHTRRELSLLLPAIVAAAAQKPLLPSKSYEFSDLPVKVNEKTHGETRQVFDGKTHDGEAIDLHITTLAPGQMPHAAHHHVYEELIFIQTGKLEVMINGKISHVGPGSVVYVASNDEHGWKNVGDSPAQYFVLALGDRG
jgi:quercetin dioxygenase-like cupin family protein